MTFLVRRQHRLSLTAAAAAAALLSTMVASAFVVTTKTNHYRSASSSSARMMAFDPTMVHDAIHQQLPHASEHLHNVFSSTFALADGDASTSIVDAVTSPVTDAVSAASDAVADPATADAGSSNGWFGFLTVPIEGVLQMIHTGIVGAGLGANTWGISIIALTILVKALTFPLNKAQLESTTKMQQLQPAIKEIQTKYESNQEVMNQKIAEFYQANEINPLAGCLPSLVQIPVFIGLYRAVLTLAKDNALDEPFLWLPNLEGPVYGADPAHGSDWILKGWVDGVPSLGWDDTIAFLILPVFLVISQFISMELMQPKDGPAQNQNFVLKLLPLMIGWFSLNVPAALCIYWVVNNLITTASTLAVRNSLKPQAVAGGVGGSTTTSAPDTAGIFTPMREKPPGFAASATVDAEIVDDDDVDEYDDDDEVEELDSVLEESTSSAMSGGVGMDSTSSEPKSKRGGGKRKKKKKKRRN